MRTASGWVSGESESGTTTTPTPSKSSAPCRVGGPTVTDAKYGGLVDARITIDEA